MQKFKGPKTERSQVIKGLKHMRTEQQPETNEKYINEKGKKTKTKRKKTSEYISMKPKIIINW